MSHFRFIFFDCDTVSHLKPFFLIRKGNQIVKRKELERKLVHLVQRIILLLTGDIAAVLGRYAVLDKVGVNADHRVVFLVGGVCQVNVRRVLYFSRTAEFLLEIILDIRGGAVQRFVRKLVHWRFFHRELIIAEKRKLLGRLFRCGNFGWIVVTQPAVLFLII